MRSSLISLVLFGAACATHQPAATELATTGDELAVEMNTPAELDVLDNDLGVETGRVVELVGATAHGTATLDDGVLHYVPAADYLGDDGADYRITNPDGKVATGHVAIGVGCTTCAIGATVTLAWNPNAPNENVTGYRTYMGTTEDTAAMVMIDDIAIDQAGFDATMPTIVYDAWTELHLHVGDHICFALTAYNTAGESGFSNAACTIVMKKAMKLGL
jgi:hypothetical protein